MKRSYSKLTKPVETHTGTFSTDIYFAGAEIVDDFIDNDNILSCCRMQTGNKYFQRNGNKVTYTSVRVWGSIEHSMLPSLNKIDGNKVRLALVWDKYPSQDPVPAFNSIFGVNTSGNAQLYDPIEPGKTNRFEILWDKRIAPNPKIAITGDWTHSWYNFDEEIFLDGYSTHYKTTGPSVPIDTTDITSGNLLFVVRCATGNAANKIKMGNESIVQVRYNSC